MIIQYNTDHYNKLMGSELKSVGSPVFTVRTVGTADITRVEIKKNGGIVFTTEPNRRNVELRWRDREFDESQTCCYYVRIVQANNAEAVSSPIWTN